MASAEVVSLDSRRPLTIGGSEAAAACGLDPYRSRVALWAEKTGRIIPRRTEAMQWGTLLEPVIRGVLWDRGYEFEPSPKDGFQDEQRPWFVGHPDGFTNLDGWPAVLEIKTASAWQSRDWQDAAGAPLAPVLQCQHYLELTGYSWALLACLVGGQRLELRRVSRDDDAIAAMLALEEEFCGYVARDEPPAPDGSESARAALAELWPESKPAETVRLDRDAWREVQTLHRRRAQRDELERQIAELEQRLKARMGSAQTAIGPNDETVARWTSYSRTDLDRNRLRDELPAVADKYQTTQSVRRLTLE